MTITKPGLVHGMSDATIRISLGGGHYAVADKRDADVLAEHNWRLLRGHNGKLYAYSTGRVYMHRLIAATPVGMETDHINGDGLDNRRCNLRSATRSQNKANMGKPARPGGAPHTSRYKGVSWDKSRSRWQSKICVDGLCRNLGRYDSERAAARAYDRAAIEAWGEFATTNFSEGVVA